MAHDAADILRQAEAYQVSGPRALVYRQMTIAVIGDAGGAQASAMIYSLIETAKENDLDPYRYLLWILRNAPSLSEIDEAWPEKLLPGNAPEECYMP